MARLGIVMRTEDEIERVVAVVVGRIDPRTISDGMKMSAYRVIVIARKSGEAGVVVKRIIFGLLRMITGPRRKLKSETESVNVIEIVTGMHIGTGIGTAAIATITRTRIGIEGMTGIEIGNIQIFTETMIDLVEGAYQSPVASATHHPNRRRARPLQH